MALEIREGSAVDPEVLRHLFQHVPWARTRTQAGIRKMLDHTDYIFSAWEGDQLVAFTRVLTDRTYRATLWDVVVHPDYQKSGVGELLLQHILSHPDLVSVERFWLNTRDKFRFFEKFGFTRSDQGMVRINSNRENHPEKPGTD